MKTIQQPVSDSIFFNKFNEAIEAHLKAKITKAEILKLSQSFRREGVVKLGKVLPDEVKLSIRNEVLSLLENCAERNDPKLLTTGNTPRYMSIVRRKSIITQGKVINSMYHCPALIHLLEEIADEKFYPCPEQNEEYLITFQDKLGDTHGWHWGEYSFALIWIIEMPPLEVGGMLQCVPHTNWDKESPRIHEYLRDNVIRTYAFEAGDLYLLRDNTTLHQTVPLKDVARRTILNMTWAAQRELSKTTDRNVRWWA